MGGTKYRKLPKMFAVVFGTEKPDSNRKQVGCFWQFSVVFGIYYLVLLVIDQPVKPENYRTPQDSVNDHQKVLEK